MEALILSMASARKITGRVLSQEEETREILKFAAWGKARGLRVEMTRELDDEGEAIWHAYVVTDRGRVGGPIDNPTHWMDAMERAGLGL